MSKRGDNIRKRKDGRWEGRYKIGKYENGKTKYQSVYGKTYSEVKNKLLESQKNPARKTESISNETVAFSDVLLKWLDNNRIKLKGSTEYKYQYLIEKHIIPELGNTPICQINSTLINAFLDKKSNSGRIDNKGGLSSSYLKTISFILQAAINYAVQEKECIPLNLSITKPILRKNELNILSKKEQRIFEGYLYNSIDSTRLAVLICLHTGLRLGEVCALTWNDIDLRNKTIHVRHTISRVKNKLSDNLTSTILVVDTPKTQSSSRVIPISSALLPYLKDISYETGEHYVLSGNSSFLSPRTLEYRFSKLIRTCGLTPINFHALRHTFATRCIEVGVDIKSLSEILGHASVGITLNTYVHSSMDLKREQIEKLANYNI